MIKWTLRIAEARIHWFWSFINRVIKAYHHFYTSGVSLTWTWGLKPLSPDRHPACKKHKSGGVVCLVRGADLPPTVSCFSKIQIGFTFLVAVHLGSPGQRAVKRVYKRVCYNLKGIDESKTPHYRSTSIQQTDLFVVWPTMSCFADWSKRHHVTLSIIICSPLHGHPGWQMSPGWRHVIFTKCKRKIYSTLFLFTFFVFFVFLASYCKFLLNTV